jgi:transcriptional regulator with XRE-family HTH domain
MGLETAGERLKYYSVRAYDKDQDLAEALGMSNKNLSNYITGTNKFGMKMYKRLKNIGAPADWIVDGTGEYKERTLDEIGPGKVHFTDEDKEKENLIAHIKELESANKEKTALIEELLSDKEVYENAVKLLSAGGDTLGTIAKIVSVIRSRKLK